VSRFLRKSSGSQRSSKAQTVSCADGLLYGVRAGETFSSIASKFDVPLSDLMEANPGVDTPRVGMILCIPGISGRICTSGGLVTVVPGDTLLSLAREHGVPLARVIAVNPWIPNPMVLFPGEQVCIPGIVPPPVDECTDGLLYAVRSGETCFSIASKFDIPTCTLLEANPTIDCRRLQVGQVLCIPGVAEELCPDGTLYTVEQGDTVFTIAADFNVSIDALVAANPWIPNPALIFPGEQLCIPEVPPPGTCNGGLLYGVRSGETCFSIASKFDITVTELRNANPGLDCDRLQVGQILCIPGVADELCPDGTLYTVEQSDTVFTIAADFNVSIDALVAANPWVPNPILIFPGEQLCVPEVPPPDTCSGGLLYGVRSGETCFGIARKFDVTVTELRNANPGLDCDQLQVGQILCIPGVAGELCPDGTLYTVEQGETVFTIAADFDVSIASLVAANPWVPNPILIFPGEQLCVPV